ncbi:MFS transporter [Kutzneria sp. CA-103260]|uniref:MFS transporter n=1 Tax=Kutzneria sp. CA-103260 TaxID=2802641 RepID=UPI001BAA1778|nr:MFS transporter [Kutzneria sp. CA-103260]QUQ67192.1 Major Facilitator Superfamily protein [Kutzneria sp. CA-103260]
MRSALTGSLRIMNEKTTVGSPVVTATVVCVGCALSAWVWMFLVLPQVLTDRSGDGDLGQVLVVALALALTAAGRLVVGVLTDRYGARVLLSGISATAAVLLAAIGIVQSAPLQALLLVCAAGVAGAMFPAGLAAVARVCPPRRKGLMLATCGGCSLSGAAAAALTLPLMVDGRWRLILTVLLLVGFAVLVPLLVRGRHRGTAEPVSSHTLRKALGIPWTFHLALLYVVVFGTQRGMMLYLPAYLHADYQLAWTRAVLFTTGVMAVAALARPVGGWLADRKAGRPTLVVCIAAAGACTLLQAFRPPLPWGVLALGGVALSLGVASGTALALIGVRIPTGRVGAIAGAVEAAGVVATLVAPTLMLVAYTLNDYSFGVALAVMSALLVATALGVRRWQGLFGMCPEPVTTVTATAALLDEFDPIEFLHGVTAWCVELPEIDAAGLVVVDHGGCLRVVASSVELNALTQLLVIQDVQSPNQECLRANAALHHGDLAAATRWPRFAPLAVQAGFASVQALPVRLRGQTIGVLTLLSRRLGALNDTGAMVQALVDLAAISLVHERAVRDPVASLTQRHALLHGRAVIEQAKGVLAARLGVDMDTAFTLLRGHDRRLVDIARDAINGRLPRR